MYPDDVCDLCMSSEVNVNRTTPCGKTIGIECGCDDSHPDGKCNDLDCEDCHPVEPQEDDYTTEDHIHFYQYGKLVVTVPKVILPGFKGDDCEVDDWRPHVKAHMDKEQFWPNVFWISDHGNAHLLSWGDK